jgi:hypothetical protein
MRLNQIKNGKEGNSMNTLQNFFKQPFGVLGQDFGVNQILNRLNPEQKELAMKLREESEEKRAEFIADWCNQNGVGKEQLEKLLKGIIN